MTPVSPNGFRSPPPMRLERIDPALNQRRYYELRLTPLRFGGVALERRWGRIDAAGGSRRIELFEDLAGARAAFRLWRRAKIRKGYRRAGR